MDFSKKILAIQLRNKGKSYSEIINRVDVSKSTLSNWLKDIELTKAQKNRLTKLQATAYLGAKKIQAASRKHHKEIEEEAKKNAILLCKNPFFIAGLMLYWAEGNKHMGSVQFTNSDPDMIRIMMCWFREFCAVSEDKFRIGLLIHSLHSEENSIVFWHKVTAVPSSQFHKPYVKSTEFKSRKNELYEGTCKIIVHSRDLLSKIIGWKDGVKEILLSNENKLI